VSRDGGAPGGRRSGPGAIAPGPRLERVRASDGAGRGDAAPDIAPNAVGPTGDAVAARRARHVARGLVVLGDPGHGISADEGRRRPNGPTAPKERGENAESVDRHGGGGSRPTTRA
jgi:hypothetical protein